MSRAPVPLHDLEVPAPHVLPFAIGSFDTIGPLSRAEFPHRHTFHEIAYVTGGSGAHVVDLERWPLAPPNLAVVVPGRIHRWERVRGLAGWVVLFTEDFLVAHPEDRDALQVLAERPWLCPDEREAAGVRAVLAEMEREYRAGAAGFVGVLQAYLHILLVRARRLPGAAASGAADGRADSVARRFSRLLSGPGRPVAGLTVRACAARVGVSPGHLNDAVRRATGHTPGHLLRQARAREAKRLLAATDLPVNRIARLSGFADPAYFCRFFRRETGTSPGAFRRAARAEHHDAVVLSIDHFGPPA
ncbi:AraC family transcriptional regulator [Streptomyces capparidis]